MSAFEAKVVETEATAAAVTVNDASPVTASEVARMITLPAATPVTAPLDDTVAMVGSSELHVTASRARSKGDRLRRPRRPIGAEHRRIAGLRRARVTNNARGEAALPEFSDSRVEPFGPDRFPEGVRAMTAGDGDALTRGRTVLIFDRGTTRVTEWTAQSVSNAWGWRIARGSESLRRDMDDPDYWSDADEASGRPRRGPETLNGRYVAVVRERSRSATDSPPQPPWVTSELHYFASDIDASQHQKSIDAKARRAPGGIT